MSWTPRTGSCISQDHYMSLFYRRMVAGYSHVQFHSLLGHQEEQDIQGKRFKSTLATSTE